MWYKTQSCRCEIENKKTVQCVPEGTYITQVQKSPRFGKGLQSDTVYKTNRSCCKKKRFEYKQKRDNRRPTQAYSSLCMCKGRGVFGQLFPRSYFHEVPPTLVSFLPLLTAKVRPLWGSRVSWLKYQHTVDLHSDLSIVLIWTDALSQLGSWSSG